MESSNHFKSIGEINDTLYLEYFGTRERLKNDTYMLDNNVPIKTGLKQLDSKRRSNPRNILQRRLEIF